MFASNGQISELETIKMKQDNITIYYKQLFKVMARL